MAPPMHEDERESPTDVDPERTDHLAILDPGADDDAVARAREKPLQGDEHDDALRRGRGSSASGKKTLPNARRLDQPERHRDRAAKSLPNPPMSSATTARSSPIVTRTWLMGLPYSGRMSTNSVMPAATAPPSVAPAIASTMSVGAPRDEGSRVANLDAGVGAKSHEQPVGEVEHVHQSVDQRQARSREEVDGAESDTAEGEGRERRSRCSRHAEELTDEVGIAEVGPPRRGGRPRRGRARRSARRGASRRSRFCSTSSIVAARRRRSRASANSVTSFGASPLEGSSTKRSGESFSSTRAIESICCWPPESVPARWRARDRSSGKSAYTSS